METINGDLLIHGDLLCGDDGVLEATGNVIWHFDLAPEGERMEEAKELFKDMPKGDFNLAGRKIRVEGNCLVWSGIIYDSKTFKGHVSACCDYKQWRLDVPGEPDSFDLFIITPEPELTEFEKRVEEICNSYEPGKRDSKEQIKYYAAELFALAREQLIKDDYIIEKKAFHDAVEKIDDKHKAEMCVEYSLHCRVKNGTRHAVMNWEEFQKVAQHFIDCGKAEALKDLPRWRKWGNGGCGNGQGIPLAIVKRGLNGYELVGALGIPVEQYIMLSDLEKLPKED